MTDVVYNDFYVAEGADVIIVAGCGIHNAGCNDTRHDGIHSFHVGKNASVRYEEKHYGEGEGTGEKILNPVTKIYLEEGAVFTLDTAQIKGVDSSVRETDVFMGEKSKLFVTERLMTHDKQTVVSNMEVQMNGEGSAAKIASRSVAKGNLPRPSIRRLLEMRPVMPMFSVIPSLWIKRKSVPFLKSMPDIWMHQLFMRQPSEELIMNS